MGENWSQHVPIWPPFDIVLGHQYGPHDVM